MNQQDREARNLAAYEAIYAKYPATIHLLSGADVETKRITTILRERGIDYVQVKDLQGSHPLRESEAQTIRNMFAEMGEVYIDALDEEQADHEAEQAHLAGQAARTAAATGEWMPEPTPTPPAGSVPHTEWPGLRVYQLTAANHENAQFDRRDIWNLQITANPIYLKLETAQAIAQARRDEDWMELHTPETVMPLPPLEWLMVEDGEGPTAWTAECEETGVTYTITQCEVL